MKYDASAPLSKLERGDADPEAVWSELWEELYHQGDIGVASFAAVTHIARITREKGILSFHPFGLVVAIDLARGRGNNPDVPDWLKNDYGQALRDLARYACQHLDTEWDAETLTTILGLIAVVKGNRDLAELITEVDTGSEKEALEKYFEY